MADGDRGSAEQHEKRHWPTNVAVPNYDRVLAPQFDAVAMAYLHLAIRGSRGKSATLGQQDRL